MSALTNAATGTPAGWEAVSDQVHAAARDAALVALGATGAGEVDRAAVDRVAAYYDPAGNYAGATFLSMQPNDPHVFTAADLHAVTLLSVELDPRSTRRLLEFGEPRQRLAELLGRIPPHADLAAADEALLLAMSTLHKTVMTTLAPPGREDTSEKWVRAAKLCARKRPHLFPVRDELVRAHLQILSFANREVDYLVFRALMQDQQVQAALAELVSRVRQDRPGVVLDDCGLRVLDVALWTYAKQGADRQRP